MLSAETIVHLQDELTIARHTNPGRARSGPSLTSRAAHADTRAQWLDRVARQHQANYDLWHIEDEARAPGATDAELADTKRRIDKINQVRNDLAESLDRALLDWLKPRTLPLPTAPLHSESPGLIIDRLSILALKIFHTREELKRNDCSTTHAERNLGRLAVLEEQRADLANCLDALWHETLAGTRRFKIYRQLKMYNDPALNPAIYRKIAL